MTKKEIRSDLNADLDAFLAAGGKITVGKSAKVRRRNAASGHQKLSFSWKPPVDRPSNAWDLVL